MTFSARCRLALVHILGLVRFVRGQHVVPATYTYLLRLSVVLASGIEQSVTMSIPSLAPLRDDEIDAIVVRQLGATYSVGKWRAERGRTWRLREIECAKGALVSLGGIQPLPVSVPGGIIGHESACDFRVD